MRALWRIARLGAIALAGSACLALLAVVATGGIAEIGHQARAGSDTAREFVAVWRKNLRSHSLETADIGRDVDRAFRRSDFRFVAIGGVGPFFPGLERKSSEVESFTRRYGYRFIEGTSDFVDSPEQDRFQTAAYEYAKSYNLRLYSRVVSR